MDDLAQLRGEEMNAALLSLYYIHTQTADNTMIYCCGACIVSYTEAVDKSKVLLRIAYMYVQYCVTI